MGHVHLLLLNLLGLVLILLNLLDLRRLLEVMLSDSLTLLMLGVYGGGLLLLLRIETATISVLVLICVEIVELHLLSPNWCRPSLDQTIAWDC